MQKIQINQIQCILLHAKPDRKTVCFQIHVFRKLRQSSVFFYCFSPVFTVVSGHVCLVQCIRSPSTAMVMSGQSLHLTTHFSWESLTK